MTGAELIAEERKQERIDLLIEYIHHLFNEIREDWSDPRWDCREGWEAVSRLREELGLYAPAKPYRHAPALQLTDDQYFERIRGEMPEIDRIQRGKK